MAALRQGVTILSHGYLRRTENTVRSIPANGSRENPKREPPRKSTADMKSSPLCAGPALGPLFLLEKPPSTRMTPTSFPHIGPYIPHSLPAAKQTAPPEFGGAVDGSTVFRYFPQRSQPIPISGRTMMGGFVPGSSTGGSITVPGSVISGRSTTNPPGSGFTTGAAGSASGPRRMTRLRTL